MNKIHVLDEATASQIAAGEVIERPAGVLKELLENSVDAGATSINIDIKGGGRELIRINDNGCGMTAEDLATSILRHATSKIKTFNDLNTLRSFGFRGEALYSVAAVSNMTLTSCVPGGVGSRVEVSGGKVLSQSPAPAIAGTSIEIKDLFFNVPARLKFLKSEAYENACLLKVVEESALANLQVGYSVFINGREKYRLPAQDGPVEEAVIARAKEILGTEVGGNLLAKSFENLGLKIFVTPPEKLVATRDLQFVFVNRRPVESKTIQQAIYRAFQNVRSKDRHPAFIIYLELDPASFDVNIHPQKRDIRFADERAMFNAVLNAVSETIFYSATAVPMSVKESSASAQTTDVKAPLSVLKELTPAPKESAALFEEKLAALPLSVPAQKPSVFTPKPTFMVRETEEPVPYGSGAPAEKAPSGNALPAGQETLPAWWKGPYRYLGQLQNTYLVFENPDGLILIDQHAAQERVLYEQYLDSFEKQDIAVQELIFPIHVDLPPSNAESLMSWAPWLKTAGFDISLFSARTILLNSLPAVLRFKENDMKNFVQSLAQIVGDPAKSDDSLKKKMVAMLACKKAIKAHDVISAAEAEALLDSMKKCKDGMHCPHGRPCVVSLAIKDIAKLFGR